jgi:purine-binding chemotaxis protein CheW
MTADEKDAIFVVFVVEGQRHAVDLERVRRVFPAVATTPLASVPDFVEGCVDVHGSIVAAINMRARLGLPRRAVILADHFMLVETLRGPLLLITDGVRELMPLSRDLLRFTGADAAPGLVTAEIRTEGGSIFIDDVDRLLTAAEAAGMESVLASAAGAVP